MGSSHIDPLSLRPRTRNSVIMSNNRVVGRVLPLRFNSTQGQEIVHLVFVDYLNISALHRLCHPTQVVAGIWKTTVLIGC